MSDADDDGGGEDRAAIMRRRAIFVVTALAGVGLATNCSDPRPCLKQSTPHTEIEPTGPQPCLSPPYVEPDDAGAWQVGPDPDASAPEAADAGTPDAGGSSTDGGKDAGPKDAGPKVAGPKDAGPPPRDAGPPRPCLKMKPPPPTVCLSPPFDD